MPRTSTAFALFSIIELMSLAARAAEPGKAAKTSARPGPRWAPKSEPANVPESPSADDSVAKPETTPSAPSEAEPAPLPPPPPIQLFVPKTEKEAPAPEEKRELM